MFPLTDDRSLSWMDVLLTIKNKQKLYIFFNEIFELQIVNITYINMQTVLVHRTRNQRQFLCRTVWRLILFYTARWRGFPAESHTRSS